MIAVQKISESHAARTLIDRLTFLWSISWLFIIGVTFTAAIAAAEDPPSVPPAVKTIVLMRIKTSLNGRPADLSANFLYGLAKVESDELMRPVSPIGITTQDSEHKWVYFELLSGTYHFWLIPPRTDLKRYRFHFEVPNGQPVLYVGSIEFNCWSKSALLGYALDFCWNLNAVRNESDLAQRIAASLAGKENSFVTALMQPYGSPLPGDLLSTLEPISVVTRSGSEGVSADWSNRPPMKRWASLGGGLAAMMLSPLCIGYAGYLGIGLCFLGGLANVVGAVDETQTELRENEELQSKWVACQKKLGQELAGLDASRDLQQRLGEWMKKRPPSAAAAASQGTEPEDSAAAQPPKSFLEAEILQVIMRECRGRDSLCIELKVRARLWSAREQRYLYDAVFFQPKSTETSRWSGETAFPWLDLPFYNYDVPSNAAGHVARTIDAFCAEDGSKLFRDDMTAAIDASSQRIIQHLGWQR